MDIERFLEDLKWKRYGGRFSKDDEVTLLNIIEQTPCHIEAQLLLIECAHYNHPRFFPYFWTFYYEAAIELGSKCWKPEELAEVYLLGRQLYCYDQNNEAKENEAVINAFELAPNYWRAIAVYLSYFGDNIGAVERLKLIQHITNENPKDPYPYYRQARFFEDYAAEFGEIQYREAAITAYQKSLDLGIDRPPSIPRKVVEEELKKVREMLDKDGSESQ